MSPLIQTAIFPKQDKQVKRDLERDTKFVIKTTARKESQNMPSLDITVGFFLIIIFLF